MPKLSELTDYQPEEQVTPSGRLYVSPNIPTSEDGDYFTKPVAPMPELGSNNIVERIIKKLAETEFSGGTDIGNKLAGTGGKERYQLWPEKIVRSALTAIPDAYSGKIPMTGLTREDFTDVPYEPKDEDRTWFGKALGIDPVAPQPSDQMIGRAMDMASFAGAGGIAGTGEGGMALGAGPSLRPALKYKDRLYKGKEGQQHMDVIPPQLYPEFQKMAMSGEDISHYNFGFVNDKGHFLSREDALKYGIDSGLIDPQAGKFGALTSTLMADSSKPGTAIEAMAKTGKPRDYMEVKKNIDGSDPNYVYHITNAERADEIATNGLKTHKPWEFTEQSMWPDRSLEKRNYFSPTSNNWHFAPEEGSPTLLRVKKDAHPFKTESTGDIYSTKKISPDKIEYLNSEGKWVALKSDSEAGAGLAAMKSAAMNKGFPLFSGKYMFTPVDGDPFAKDRK